MSVHQLKDGRWIVQYTNKGPGPRLRREYFGRGPEAERRARDRNESLKLRPTERRTPYQDEKTFDMLADAYMIAKRGVAQDTTLERLHLKLKKVILPEIGGEDVRRLSHYRIDQYVNKRLRDGVTRTTVNNEVTYMLAILNWSVRRRYIQVNPLAGYEKPKRDDKIIQPVTARESAAILQNAAPHLVRALALSYYTGLRPGKRELLGIPWSAVDWDRETILIISARKGGIASRTVPIHDDLHPMICIWYSEDLGEGKTNDDSIITYKGRPIKRISKSFNAAKRRAGITRKLPPYAFRHAFATGMLSEGGDLKATSEILGHTRTGTTTRIYQHTNLKMRRKEINKLPPLQW